MTRLKALSTGFALLVLVSGLFWTSIRCQGLSKNDLERWNHGKITRDAHDIYDIQAETWGKLAESQGFVLAGERFFQMDLLRRKASGRLAELFGSGALNSDRKQAEQDWLGTADKAVTLLPIDQRTACEAYARGVNHFLHTHRYRVGIEYLILRSAPEDWQCRDTILVVMTMIDSMTNFEKDEIISSQWRSHLPVTWWTWFYDQSHPDNHPLIEIQPGSTKKVSNTLPPKKTWLTKKTVESQELKTEDKPIKPANGSNSWAYRGTNGAWLANDPHIGYQVPQVWFALKYHTPSTGRVAGTALPGLPGVLIGANENLGWALTNTMEDVDDLLIEELDSTGTQYRGFQLLDDKNFLPLEITTRTIKVRGAPDEIISIKKTIRGPIIHRDEFPDVPLSRQWIGLHPKWLQIPMEALNTAKDWQSFNEALDHFQSIPLNFTMLDRENNIGYRVSGVGIKRRAIGTLVQQASTGMWSEADIEPSSSRYRLYLSNTAQKNYLATANQRIWDDHRYHHWADDDRVHRIENLLVDKTNLSEKDMETMQLDTHVEFHLQTIRWLLKYAQTGTIPQKEYQRLDQWKGDARQDPYTMTIAIQVIDMLRSFTFSRLKQKATSLQDTPPLRRIMWRSWYLKAFQDDNNFMPLGTEAKELATAISRELFNSPELSKQKPYFMTNAQTTQHPFSGRIPLIGRLFSINNPDQFGYANALLAESPNHGPSTRLIWDLRHPENSRWAFPIGQSGHIGSGHFNDWQELWAKGEFVPVF